MGWRTKETDCNRNSRYLVLRSRTRGPAIPMNGWPSSSGFSTDQEAASGQGRMNGLKRQDLSRVRARLRAPGPAALPPKFLLKWERPWNPPPRMEASRPRRESCRFALQIPAFSVPSLRQARAPREGPEPHWTKRAHRSSYEVPGTEYFSRSDQGKVPNTISSSPCLTPCPVGGIC